MSRQYSSKFVLETKNFIDGIKAIREASPIYNKILDEMDLYADEDRGIDLYVKDTVELILIETLWIDPEVTPISEVLDRPRGLNAYTKSVFEYVNDDSVAIGWMHKVPSDKKSPWIFWVLIPEEDYVEPGEEEMLSECLEAQGFYKDSF